MEDVKKATAAEDSENCSGETMGSNASLDGSRRKEAPAECGANPKEYQRSKSHTLANK